MWEPRPAQRPQRGVRGESRNLLGVAGGAPCRGLGVRAKLGLAVHFLPGRRWPGELVAAVAPEVPLRIAYVLALRAVPPGGQVLLLVGGPLPRCLLLLYTARGGIRKPGKEGFLPLALLL